MMRHCSIAGCERPYRCKGYCRIHYRRSMKGTPMDGSRVQKGCKFEGCERDFYCKGYCLLHYDRSRRGAPMEAPHRCSPLIERLPALVDKSDGCWVWLSGKGRGGYGQVTVNGQTMSAHRVVYELLVGPIPEGLQIDHLCRVRACVNPEHLEPVTAKENVHRSESPAGRNFRKTHCKHGHPFDEENTYRHRRGRACRRCIKATQTRYKTKRKEKECPSKQA